MDIVSYSYADKQSKRLDNLFHVGETAPAKIVLGQEWAVPSTGKVYKRVNDGTQDIWKDVTGSSTSMTKSTEDYVAGTPLGNYTGGLNTVELNKAYKVGFINVFLNGRVLPVSDYIAQDGLTVTFNTPLTAGDEIKVETFNTFSITTGISGMPDETGKVFHKISTNGLQGDSYWTPMTFDPNTISQDVTIPVGASASIVSPTIEDGVTITVPDGSTLVIL